MFSGWTGFILSILKKSCQSCEADPRPHLLECVTRMHKIFSNDVGRLRSGWRLLIFFETLIFLSIVWGVVARLIIQFITASGFKMPHSPFVFEVIFRFGLTVISLGLGFLCARGLEDLPWRSLGMTFHEGWLRDLAVGFAIGFAALVLAVAIAWKGLSFSFDTGGSDAIVISMIGSAALLFVGAIAEEAMFRGYGLQTLLTSAARMARCVTDVRAVWPRSSR